MQPGLYTFTEVPEALLARFRAARLTDRGVERRTRLWGLLTLVAGVGAVLLVVAAVAGERLAPLLYVPLPIAAAVLLGRRWRAWRRLDIDDRRLETIQRVVAILRADIAATTPVQLDVDLRQMPEPSLGTGQRKRERVRWLALRARLADRTTVALTLTDRLAWKRKRRGMRTQVSSGIAVSVRLADRYDGADAIVTALTRSHPPAGLKTRRAWAPAPAAGRRAAPGREVRATFQTDVGATPTAAADEVLRALAWVYAGIRARGR